MRIRTFAVLASSAIWLAGCVSVAREINPYKIGHSLNGKPLSVSQEFANKFHDHPNDANLHREFAYFLVHASDSECEDYLIGIDAGRNGYTTGLSLTSLILSAVGGFATPVRTANMLSSGSTLAQGASRTLSENLFGGKDFTVIYTAIHQARDKARKQIEQDIDAGKFDSWAPESIVTYINAPYHLSCGVNFGLEEISTSLSR